MVGITYIAETPYIITESSIIMLRSARQISHRKGEVK